MNEVYYNGRLYKQYNEGLMFAITFFLGTLGVHRFLLGKYVTGIIWFFTFGLLGIGWLWDVITIISKVRKHNAFVEQLIQQKRQEQLLNQAIAKGTTEFKW